MAEKAELKKTGGHADSLMATGTSNMKILKCTVSDIEWDTEDWEIDGEDLPTETTIELDEDDMTQYGIDPNANAADIDADAVIDAISDKLPETYEVYPLGFNVSDYEFVEQEDGK